MTTQEAKDLLRSIPGKAPIITIFKVEDERTPCIAISGDLHGEEFNHVGGLENGVPLLKQFKDMRDEVLDMAIEKTVVERDWQHGSGEN